MREPSNHFRKPEDEVHFVDTNTQAAPAAAPELEISTVVAMREAETLPAAVTPMAMIDRALASGAPVETLEKLLALQERWEASQARKAFDEAMAHARAEIVPIIKNRVVDFTSSKGRTHYKHEDLAGIARSVNPILARHGLSYRFRTTNLPNEPVTVTCVVAHRLGHSEENTLCAARDESGNKNSIQAVGSTVTYLQRYTLKASLGLAAADDDDGNGASKDAGAISEEQLAHLRRLISDLEMDEGKISAFAKVDSLANLPARDFDKIASAINDQARARRTRQPAPS